MRSDHCLWNRWHNYVLDRKILHNTPIKSDIPNDRRLISKSVNRSHNATNYLQFKNINTYFLTSTKILELLRYLLQRWRYQNLTKKESVIAPIQRFIVNIKAFFGYIGLA
jgi:hypothetical protein